MALAIALRADGSTGMARNIHGDRGPFTRRTACGFQKTGNAAAEQFAAPCCLFAPYGETCCVRSLVQYAKICCKAPTIHRHTHGRAVRRIGQHIHRAQLGRIAAQTARRGIHQTFYNIIRLWLAGPAIGIHWQAIGEGAAYFQMHGGYRVHAAHRRGESISRAMRTHGRKIGTHICDTADLHA